MCIIPVLVEWQVGLYKYRYIMWIRECSVLQSMFVDTSVLCYRVCLVGYLYWCCLFCVSGKWSGSVTSQSRGGRRSIPRGCRANHSGGSTTRQQDEDEEHAPSNGVHIYPDRGGAVQPTPHPAILHLPPRVRHPPPRHYSPTPRVSFVL